MLCATRRVSATIGSYKLQTAPHNATWRRPRASCGRVGCERSTRESRDLLRRRSSVACVREGRYCGTHATATLSSPRRVAVSVVCHVKDEINVPVALSAFRDKWCVTPVCDGYQQGTAAYLCASKRQLHQRSELVRKMQCANVSPLNISPSD